MTTKILPTIFSGSDSIKVTFDLLDLELNTEYEFYVETLSQDDKVITTSKSVFFKTYAVSDYDGNLYHTVTIGTETWLQENFKGTHYANGDVIPNVQDSAQCANQTTGAYCYYKNDPEIGKVYGGLYNWYVASDSRGLIAGYHTPSESVWMNLIVHINVYVNGQNAAGRYLKETGTAHWQNPNYGSNNSTGFTGLPGGQKSLYRFGGITTEGVFWSSTVYPEAGLAYVFFLSEGVPSLNSGGDSYCKGSSIRLVKN